MKATTNAERLRNVGQPPSLPSPAVFFHRHDSMARDGQHDVGTAAWVGMLLSKLQHSSVITPGNEPGRSDDALLLNDVLRVLEGRTRPVRTPSTRGMPPRSLAQLLFEIRLQFESSEFVEDPSQFLVKYLAHLGKQIEGVASNAGYQVRPGGCLVLWWSVRD